MESTRTSGPSEHVTQHRRHRMSFLEIFLSALGGATVPVVILGYLGRTFIEHRLKKDLKDYEAVIAEQSSIRATVNKYSRVILLSAADLQDRLWHLCKHQSALSNKFRLGDDESSTISGTWPMTKKHYLTGTLYLFARYFCWVEILKSRIRFLEFNDDTKTNVFNYHLKRVERMLAETSLQDFAQQTISTDKPVFQLMQNEIGESLRTASGTEDQCISFHEFSVNFNEIIKNNEGLQQLEALLLSSITSEMQNSFCLTRLKLVCNALMDMVEFLYEHNNLSQAEKLEKVDIGAFHNDKYLAKWPPAAPDTFSQPTVFADKASVGQR